MATAEISQADIDYISSAALAVARPYGLREDQIEDVLQDALLVLVKKAEGYDPSRGLLVSRAYPRAMGTVCDSVRRIYGRKHKPDYQLDQNQLESEKCSHDERSGRIENVLVSEIFAEIHRKLPMPERTAEIIRRIYYEDERQEDIGKRLGIAQSRVNQIHLRFLRHMRSFLDPESRGSGR